MMFRRNSKPEDWFYQMPRLLKMPQCRQGLQGWLYNYLASDLWCVSRKAKGGPLQPGPPQGLGSHTECKERSSGAPAITCLTNHFKYLAPWFPRCDGGNYQMVRRNNPSFRTFHFQAFCYSMRKGTQQYIVYCKTDHGRTWKE